MEKRMAGWPWHWKFISTVVFVLASPGCFAQKLTGKNDLQQIKNKKPDSLQFTGKIVLSKIGFSPVPSFSFDSPVASIFISLSKKRISYEPAIFWGLTGKPWIIDNWLKYRFIDTRKIKVSAGINPGIFFKSEYSDNKEEIIKANRNITTAFFGDIEFSKKFSLKLIYWYNKRFDSGTLTGHFMDITGILSDIHLSKQLFITLRPELFCFNNSGQVDGLFTSARISAGHSKYPVSLYIHVVQRVWTNFTADDFKWNSGLAYNF